MFWRAFRGNRSDLPRQRSPHAMAQPYIPTPELDMELARLGLTPRPKASLHLLFAAPELRSRRRGVTSHVCPEPLPTGSLLRVSEHVLVVSPELCFAQLAETMGPGRLILAGTELCGTYALIPAEDPADPDRPASVSAPESPTPAIMRERTQLTTSKALRALAADLPRRPGAERARRAGVHLFDGAASPMEAKVALLLALPQRLGGLGLPRPTLNHPIILGTEARKAYPHRTCRCDLYWPETQVDLEYHGADAHDGVEAYTKDVARLTALAVEGIDVIPITFAQVADPEVFLAFAFTLAKRLGHPLRLRNANFVENHAVLREELRFTAQGDSAE